MLTYTIGKAQASLLLLLFLVFVVLAGWLWGQFMVSSFLARLGKESVLTKLAGYVDTIKGFSQNAQVLAIHEACRHVAAQGGQTSATGFARSWVCNADVSPSLRSVKFFLSNLTTDYLNSYLLKLKFEDLPTVHVSEYTCTEFEVDEKVYEGTFDERFNVSSIGSTINVTLEADAVRSSNHVRQEISQLRFWYMFRIFKQWAPEGASIIAGGLCQCLPHTCNCREPTYQGFCEPSDTCPPFNQCVKQALGRAVQALQAKFDEHVSCYANLIGTYHQPGLPCLTNPCIDWPNPPACKACTIEQPGRLCGAEALKQLRYDSSQLNLHSNPDSLQQRGYCLYWHELRGSMEGLIVCTDEKYKLSVIGERELSFEIHVMAKLRASLADGMPICYKTAKCECVELVDRDKDGEADYCERWDCPGEWCVENCPGPGPL